MVMQGIPGQCILRIILFNFLLPVDLSFWQPMGSAHKVLDRLLSFQQPAVSVLSQLALGHHLSF